MDSDGVAPFSNCKQLEIFELPTTDVDSQQQQPIKENTAKPDQKQINAGDTNVLADSLPQHEDAANSTTTTTNPQNQNNKNNKSDTNTPSNMTKLYLSPPPPKKKNPPITLEKEYLKNKERALSLEIKKGFLFGKFKPSKNSSILCEVLVGGVETVTTFEEKGSPKFYNGGKYKKNGVVVKDGEGGIIDSSSVVDNVNPTDPNNPRTAESEGNGDSLSVDDNVNPTNPNNQKTSASGGGIESDISPSSKNDGAESKTKKVVVADGEGGIGDSSCVVDNIDPLDLNNPRTSASRGKTVSNNSPTAVKDGSAESKAKTVFVAGGGEVIDSPPTVVKVIDAESNEKGQRLFPVIGGISSQLSSFSKKKKVHPANTSIPSNTGNTEKSENNKKNNRVNISNSKEKTPTFSKITKTLRGQATTTVHLDYISLSDLRWISLQTTAPLSSANTTQNSQNKTKNVR